MQWFWFFAISANSVATLISAEANALIKFIMHWDQVYRLGDQNCVVIFTWEIICLLTTIDTINHVIHIRIMTSVKLSWNLIIKHPFLIPQWHVSVDTSTILLTNWQSFATKNMHLFRYSDNWQSLSQTAPYTPGVCHCLLLLLRRHALSFLIVLIHKRLGNIFH